MLTKFYEKCNIIYEKVLRDETHGNKAKKGYANEIKESVFCFISVGFILQDFLVDNVALLIEFR
jgi:hypothetical protein